MIKINLLPYHLRPIKRTPLPYIAGILILLGALAAIGYLWLDMQGQINAKRQELARHSKDLDELKAIVDEYKRLSDQKKNLKDKIDTIQEIVSDRIIWSRQLFNVSRLTPDNFWYSGVAEKEKTSQETQFVYDEATKTKVPKMVPVKNLTLELSGYVIKGTDGSNDIYPLMFNMEQDPEYSSMFQVSQPKAGDAEFKGHKVQSFTLEYLVAPKGERK